MNCEKCGTEFEGKFCPSCGKAAAGIKVTCKGCGNEYEGAFCPSCGQSANAAQTAATAPQIIINNSNTVSAPVPGVRAKNKWVAFLLCLFLGYIGAHKYYEGKILLGLLYTFTLGLFGIGWVIDCILLFFKPNPYVV